MRNFDLEKEGEEKVRESWKKKKNFPKEIFSKDLTAGISAREQKSNYLNYPGASLNSFPATAAKIQFLAQFKAALTGSFDKEIKTLQPCQH